MFAMKSIFLIAILALCNAVFAAVPPGCLLAAVNTLEQPADLDVACGKKSKDVQEEITNVCDEGKVDAALKAFQKACSDAGKDIELIPTSTTTSEPTGTGSSSPTGFQTSSAPSGSASASGSGSGATPSPTDSGSAGMVQQADSLAVAAVVAMLGFVAAI